MAFKNLPFILLFAVFTVSFTIDPSHATESASTCGISVYWGGQAASGEGTLREACATGNYSFVILDHLVLYDNGSTPELHLQNHCSDCRYLQSQIRYCQSLGIKVFLSIGALKRSSTTSSSSEGVVTDVAEYLYDNFLSDQSGPLGTVALDGIDFLGAVPEGTNIKWAALVKAIHAFSTAEKKIYLSASPHCHDYTLGDAIKTGLFDYLWVRFFHNWGCQYYDGSTASLFNSWDMWTITVPSNNLVFLGIPAAEEVAENSGYIPLDVLKSEVLPYVNQASNYGGVMLWNRFYDKKTNLSGEIRDIVCEPEPHNFYGLLSQSL